MSTLALPLVLALLASADEPPTKEALATLRKHCVPCHGDRPTHADLRVMDRKGLFDRKLVVPGKPDDSELLLLVETGAMPPGPRDKPTAAERAALRRWIAAGAPDVPPPPVVFVTGEDYVHGEIARDWAARKPALARYLSLNHLLVGPGGDRRLAEGRRQLQQTLATLTAPGKPAFELTAIDRQQSVFRLDLDRIGWDRRPFKDSAVNVFDVLLLEYPYAVAAFSDPAFLKLVPMLRATKAVRPIPYVRGDWLMAILTDDRHRELHLSDEMPVMLGHRAGVEKPKPPSKDVWDWEVNQERALREMNLKAAPVKWKEAVQKAGLGELLEGKAVAREAWEARYPALVRLLGLGVPVVPIDGLEVAFPLAGPLGVRVRTKDEGSGKDLKAFKPGMKLALLIQPTADAICEVVVRHRKGRMGVMHGPDLFARHVEKYLPKKREDAWDLGADEDEAEVIVFAIPDDGKTKLPAGARLREGGEVIRDRIVHDWYKLSEDGKSFTGPPADRILRTSVQITVGMPDDN